MSKRNRNLLNPLELEITMNMNIGKERFSFRYFAKAEGDTVINGIKYLNYARSDQPIYGTGMSLLYFIYKTHFPSISRFPLNLFQFSIIYSVIFLDKI